MICFRHFISSNRDQVKSRDAGQILKRWCGHVFCYALTNYLFYFENIGVKSRARTEETELRKLGYQWIVEYYDVILVYEDFWCHHYIAEEHEKQFSVVMWYMSRSWIVGYKKGLMGGNLMNHTIKRVQESVEGCQFWMIWTSPLEKLDSFRIYANAVIQWIVVPLDVKSISIHRVYCTPDYRISDCVEYGLWRIISCGIMVV